MIRTHYEARKARMLLAQIEQAFADEYVQMKLWEDRLATERRLEGLAKLATDTLADLQAYEDRLQETRRYRRARIR